jgi:putative DNA primase/helicase
VSEIASTSFDPLALATAAGHRPGSDEWQQAVRRFRQEHARDIGHDETAKRYRKMWEEAGPAKLDHGYLQAKGVAFAPGIRQKGELLYVPMKGLETGSPLMSLQFIWPDGTKRYGKATRTARTRTTIGASAFVPPHGTLYICEGWATGWSIHAVTEQAVVVAFSAGNLKDVALHFREKYPQASIVLCADNDRREGLNPGVAAATAAAEAAHALLAIPNFAGPSGSDFNDLHLIEGPDAVEHWLDPARAAEAVTTPWVRPPVAPEIEDHSGGQQEGDDGPPDGYEANGRTWRDRVPFRCIGHDDGYYYYLPEGAGQVTGLQARNHDRLTLMRLAPLTTWQQEFPGKEKGVDWLVAVDALIQACHGAGVHNARNIRGRGCWWESAEDGGKVLVLHLGDRLLPSGAKQWILPERYASPERFIYERMERIPGPSSKRVLTLDEARNVLALCCDLNWHEEASGHLLAGWMALSPVCGALTWRPHVWITGGSGCGKSTVLQRLVMPLLGGMVKVFEAGSTEPGIRGTLKHDAIPALYDEADKEGQASDARIQAIIGLLRTAASTGQNSYTAKGTVTGDAITYQIRSMFALASIGGSLRQEADKARVSVLQMKNKEALREDERLAHWRAYEPRLDLVTEEMGRALMSRTVGWLRDGRLLATIKTMRGAATGLLGTARSGDQYGTLLAGAWTLMADEPPAQDEARELVAAMGIGTYVSEQRPEGIRIMHSILQTEVRMDTTNGVKTFVVGELVDACAAGSQSQYEDEARKWLRAHGFEVDYDNLSGHTLAVATGSEWVQETLRGSPYSDSWASILRTLPGATLGHTRRFHAGLRSRCLLIPRVSWDPES